MCNFSGKTFQLGSVVLSLALLSSVQAEVLRDPTQPPGQDRDLSVKSNSRVQPRWVLNTTLVAQDRRLAIINGQAVGVGEQINGAMVVAIEPRQVTLQPVNGKEPVRIKLVAQDFKHFAEQNTHEK